MLMVNKYISEKALSEFTCNESNWFKNKPRNRHFMLFRNKYTISVLEGYE